LLLHPSCRYITTFSTHLGLYQYKRLSFGINAAAEIFQHEIQTVIADIPGDKNISVVYGKNQSEHDRALDQTLQRLHQSGITINPQKCEFNKPSIEFFGHIFSKDGIAPASNKVQALHDAVEPRNQTERRLFLGMAQYSARFIQDFATITEPLRQLTRSRTPWTWGRPQAESFEKGKTALSEATAMAYFSPVLSEALNRNVLAVIDCVTDRQLRIQSAMIINIIIHQIVTLSKYSHDSLNICHP